MSATSSIGHYVVAALERLGLAGLKAVAFDETASKRGRNYVTIFIDLDRKSRPEASGLLTAIAWQIKEKLRWVRVVPTPQAARWRLSHFIPRAREKVAGGLWLAPVLTASSPARLISMLAQRVSIAA